MIHNSKLERFGRDKHSCLLGLFISYKENEVLWIQPIDIESLQNRLLKACYVPATGASLPRLLFIYFLLWPLTVLMKQTRQAVHAVKQSILLRCLWYGNSLQNPSKIFGRKKVLLDWPLRNWFDAKVLFFCRFEHFPWLDVFWSKNIWPKNILST